MLELELETKVGKAPRILCLGAHSDDIEIGCGGTVLRLVRAYPEAEWYWLVFSAEEEARRREAAESAERFLDGATHKTVVVERFRTSFFPYRGAEIKERFEALKAAFEPDLILTHTRHDLHQDHRVICELTWNTYRNHFILEYEIPKYDGDLGVPNAFVALDPDTAERKIEILMRVFGTQRSKHWYDEETFRGLLRIRGLESATRYAEAFHCRKLRLGMESTPAP